MIVEEGDMWYTFGLAMDDVETYDPRAPGSARVHPSLSVRRVGRVSEDICKWIHRNLSSDLDTGICNIRSGSHKTMEWVVGRRVCDCRVADDVDVYLSCWILTGCMHIF